MSSINAKAVSDMFAFVDKAKGSMQQVTKEIMLEIGRRLVERSPVGDPQSWHPPYWPKGYVPGHFINNWQVGKGRAPAGVIEGVDPTGAKSLQRLEKLGRWQYGYVYYFVNNLPYASALENGHSKQAPLGIVAITVREYPQIAHIATVAVAKNRRWAFEG